MTKNSLAAARTTMESLRQAAQILENMINTVSDETALPEGDACPAVTVDFANSACPWDLEIHMPLNDGGQLIAYTSISDTDTRQAGIMYCHKDGSPLDIALAEVRRGELATIQHMPEDNNDISVVVWDDVTDENYTDSHTLFIEEFEKAKG